MVASVIQHHVNPSHFPHHAHQKLRIRLRTDSYLCKSAVVNAARRIDIHPEDDCLGAEVLAPHTKASSLGNSDLQKSDLLIPVSPEVSVVNGDVVMPFMSQKVAFRLSEKPQQVPIKPIFFLYVLEDVDIFRALKERDTFFRPPSNSKLAPYIFQVLSCR